MVTFFKVTRRRIPFSNEKKMVQTERSVRCVSISNSHISKQCRRVHTVSLKPGSRLTFAIHLGLPAHDDVRCENDVVENVVLTHPTNAQVEKGQGVALAIPRQGCVHLPKLT